MRKTAQTRAVHLKENLPQMKYVDLHCDTLTACLERGLSIENCNLQTSLEKLNNSGCAAQCFAVFTQGDGAALTFDKCLGIFKAIEKRDGTRPILTVENYPFGADLTKLYYLKEAGVKMLSLVWNFENELAYPNLTSSGGRESRGLKPLGRQTVEMVDDLKMIIDISHLSDGGAEEILRGRKIPVVASHSNAANVCNVPRNLTDGLIKKIADCGGVVGVNFCRKFLGEGDTFGQVLAHIKHFIKVGGEDIIAFGSDFDGIPETPGLESCERMPKLLEYLQANGISGSLIEKLCYKNFIRVFKEVCG